MNISNNGRPIIKYGNIAATIPTGANNGTVEISFEGLGFEGVPHLAVTAGHNSNANVFAKIKTISVDKAEISICTPDVATVDINGRLHWIAISTLHD